MGKKARIVVIVSIICFCSLGTVAANNKAPYEITFDNIIPLYFDLLDYMRTESLGRQFVTPQAERQRVAALILSSWSSLDAQTQATLVDIASAAQTIKSDMASMSQSERAQVLDQWRQVVLSPLWVYAPPSGAQLYSSGAFSFSFPGTWGLAEGQGYLFAGPSLDTTWDEVDYANTSPPGMLMIAYPNSAGTQSYLDLAQGAAGNFIGGLQELCSFGSGAGAIVVANGKFPGQVEEKFFWLAVIPCGDLLILARMGGPVAQADVLVPEFYNIVNSMSYQGASQGSGSSTPGETSRAFDNAWGQLSNAVVSNIWAPSK
jgi:hypothetical protein